MKNCCDELFIREYAGQLRAIQTRATQTVATMSAMLKAAFSKVRNNLFKGQLPAVAVDPSDFTIVTEGKADILFPKQEEVFYNPIQQFNRDLSVTCIQAWDHLYGSKLKSHRQRKRTSSEPEAKRRKLDPKDEEHRYITILEALSATGLRAIRYAKEIPHVKEIIANDLLPAAVKSIQRNIDYNGVQDIVTANQDDANVLMYRKKSDNKKYHVIDLDPYGTVTPFIDAALQSIEEDGLMLVTCTDLSVLAGNGYPEKCFALYGGVNMVSHDATHESALRLVLNLLNQSAAKYKKHVEPLLSLSIDFYVRVFVKVKTSPIKVKELQSNTMITYHCSQCGSFANQKLGRKVDKQSRKKKQQTITKFSVAQGPPIDSKCQFCGGTSLLAGPMYAGPLHNHEFIEEVLKINEKRFKEKDTVYGTKERIKGMLTLAKNELKHDGSQFYFSPNTLSSLIKLQVPALKTIAAGLGSLGFECSLTHAQPSTIKTNAPWDAIWYVMKKCHENKEDYQGRNLEDMPEKGIGYRILKYLEDNKEHYDQLYGEKLSFAPNETSGSIEKLRKLKIVRYQENPTKNWGPKARPSGKET